MAVSVDDAAVQQQVSATVTDTVQQQVAEQVIQTAANMSKADYDAAVAAGIIPQQTQDAVNAAIQAQMGSEAVQSKIAENVSAQMASEAVQSKITENIDTQISSEAVQATITENTDAQLQTEAIQATIQQQTELQVQKAISENMASDAVQSQLKKASEGAQTLIALKASLDDYNTFYLGLLTYTGGVDDAAAGANDLYAGADQLKDGTAQLRAGAAQLYNGVLQLQDGTCLDGTWDYQAPRYCFHWWGQGTSCFRHTRVVMPWQWLIRHWTICCLVTRPICTSYWNHPHQIKGLHGSAANHSCRIGWESSQLRECGFTAPIPSTR